MSPPRRAVRWIAVAALAGLLSAVPPLISALPASQAGISPLQLFRAIRASDRVAYQGLAESNARLGLPDLERAGRIASLLGEKTRLRVWYRGPYAWRVDDLTPIGEHGTYLDRNGIWVWDSGARTGTRVDGFTQVRFPRAADLLPPELGRRLATAARPSEISALPAEHVAGRDAAGLRITPASPDTTVAWVNIWADPSSGLPLQVQVGSRSTGGVVVSSVFLELDRTAPARSLVRFAPPPGADLSRTEAADFAQAVERYSPFVLPDSLGPLSRTTGSRGARVYGRGFDRIAVLALPARYTPLSQDELAKLQPVEGPWVEGFAAQTPLLNGLTVEHADVVYLLGGAVSTAALARAARALLHHSSVVEQTCC